MAAPTTDDQRKAPGMVLLLLTSLAIGGVGIIPFILTGYVLSQWFLVPLGLADQDATFDEGFVLAFLAGVVTPVLLLTGWALATRRICRWAALNRIAAWSTAALGLLAPTIAFVIHRT